MENRIGSLNLATKFFNLESAYNHITALAALDHRDVENHRSTANEFAFGDSRPSAAK